MKPWAVAVTVAMAAAIVLFMWSTPDAWPYGDGAIIQLYTLQSVRGFLKVGPYSQFGWHHPGPLYFYLLVPGYVLSGQRAIGLTAGALAINVGSLIAIGWLISRHASRGFAAVIVASLVIYLWRASDLAASIWNPHVIVLPLAALVVACAAAAAGDGAAALIGTFLASLVMQTHLSTVPCCLALLGVTAGLAMAGGRHLRGGEARRFRRWAIASVLLAAILWTPPIVDQLIGRGNLARLGRFFLGQPQVFQPWTVSLSAWVDMLTAGVRPALHVPWGAVYVPRPSAAAFALAALQLALAASAAFFSHRRGRPFVARLCGFTLLASLAALLSMSRIPAGTMADYQLLWLSSLGVLSWGTVAAVVVTRKRELAAGSPDRTGDRLLAVAGLAVLFIGGRAMVDARIYAVEQTRGEVTRKILSRDVLVYLERERVRRPLFHIAQNHWMDGASIVLAVYKHHGELAVDGQWTTLFGEALAANGREDIELQIVGPGQHAALSSGFNDRLIASHDDVFVHAAAVR